MIVPGTYWMRFAMQTRGIEETWTSSAVGCAMREIGAAHSEDHAAEGIWMIVVGRCLHWRAGRDSEGKHQ